MWVFFYRLKKDMMIIFEYVMAKESYLYCYPVAIVI